MEYIQQFKKDDIFYLNLGEPDGCIQGGRRPAVIVQNDTGNQYSLTLQIAPITKSKTKAKLPTHVELHKGMGGLREDSVVLAEQTTICNKNELLPQNKLEHLNDSVLDKLDNAIAIQFDLYNRRTTQRHISKRRNAICLAQ